MIRWGPSGQTPGGHIGASVQEGRTGCVGCDHRLRPVRKGLISHAQAAVWECLGQAARRRPITG